MYTSLNLRLHQVLLDERIKKAESARIARQVHDEAKRKRKAARRAARETRRSVPAVAPLAPKPQSRPRNREV